MKMSLGHEKQVKHTTTTAQDTPLKQSVQVAGSRTGKELSELLRGVETVLPSSRDRLEIQQVSCDSRKVEKGALFFALHGAQADGNAFIQDAVKRGAVAVASEEPAPKEFPRGVVWIQVRETRKALASTAANFFDHPADALQLLAVTGTNGKTTTTSLVDAIIKASRARTGLRSEERRVGEEGRSRWSPYHLKKKNKVRSVRDLIPMQLTTESGTSQSHPFFLTGLSSIAVALASSWNTSRDCDSSALTYTAIGPA